MNEELSVTEAELARVLELDAKASRTMTATMSIKKCEEIANARSERRELFLAICPRIARELAAARAAIKEAPHSTWCQANEIGVNECSPDCWKAEL